MTLNEFINFYENKKVDFDGCYGFQCVDLFRQYSKEVLNIQEHTGAVVGAKDLFINFDKMEKMKKYFEKINNVKAGDIVIFDKTLKNEFGHVAIVVYASKKSLVVFEQNGFEQSKGAYLTIRDYKNILGFLRGKNNE